MTVDYTTCFQQQIIVDGMRHLLVQGDSYDGMPPRPVMEWALHMLAYALDVVEIWETTRELVLWLAPNMESLRPSGWMPILLSCIQLSKTTKDTFAEAELQFYLGNLYRLQARYIEAEPALITSARLFRQLGDHSRTGRALNRLAYLARLQHKHAEAESLCSEATATLRDEDAEQGYTLFVRGTIAYDQRELARAATLLESSRNLYAECRNGRMLAHSLINLGPVLRQLGRKTEAIACYKEAIVLLGHDPFQQAIAQMNLGNCYLEDEPAYAMQFYAQAERVFREAQDELHLAMTATNFGIAYREIGNYEAAINSLEASVDGWQKLGDIESTLNSLDELGLAFLGRGDRQRATDTFTQALEQLKTSQLHASNSALQNALAEHLGCIQSDAKPL